MVQSTGQTSPSQQSPQQINLFDLPVFTEDEVRDAADHRCVVIIYGLVYDLTDFLDLHPGGAEVIFEMAGMDATHVFEDVGHGKLARTLLLRYVIGRLAGENPADLNGGDKPLPEHLINATKAAAAATIRG